MRVVLHLNTIVRRLYSTCTLSSSTLRKFSTQSHYNMKTDVLQVDPSHFTFKESSCEFGEQNAISIINNTSDQLAIKQAVKWLAQGEAIGIPTETVYGLAANALDASAVSKIFAAKNRPQDNPLIVHVSSLKMLESILPHNKIPDIYMPIIKRCWPGPLTIILPSSPLIPSTVTCGQPTVAVRFPSHPVARALIESCGFPLAAPSANSSGKPSPTLASHVFDDLNTKIPLILDGGPCNVGVESTVLDGLRQPPAILRPGGVTYEVLKQMEGMNGLQVYRKHFVDQALEMAPTTPGMKYRHYSPEAMVVLIEDDKMIINNNDDTQQQQQRQVFETIWQDELKQLLKNGIGIQKVGILKIVEDGDSLEWRQTSKLDEIEYVTLQMGRQGHPDEVARGMFKGLREMDTIGVDIIFVQGVPEIDEGMAVMNRLRKAATKTI
ncbi:DHBP synthase RibB-like alpha/beta domain-containing protein [Halteromyces radiatus]|uniref:DHBP synthase RibB-like alpha/beta domain-containing protein n=1 Tax=Halteromyces radiatus TaxID=101107 RepID=UPI00221F7D31|nr:DHBP synthase RibB-like alpha/beta domain-containing protein [Halteromyces radiatus]KAI8098856.1 DHBP synthase RibB-like alpha/beta domain-containing protein [Halteromyces radiatus]